MSFPAFSRHAGLAALAVLLSATAARAAEPAAEETSASPTATDSTPAGTEESKDSPPAEDKPAAPAAPEGESEPPAKAASVESEPAAPAPASAYGKDPITGAPLGPSGPREAVHVLSRPTSAMAGKFEVAVTMPVQLNPTFTEHVGNGLEVQYHFAEPFSLTAGGTYFWRSQPTEFTDVELLSKAVQAPTAAEAVSIQWESHAGFEFMPIYAKTAFFGIGTLRFGIYAGGGGGVVSTKVELQPPSSGHQTFGDTGLRPMAYVNVGFRFFFGDRFSLKLEVRDMYFASYVDRIRGCTEADIAAVANGSGSGACEKAFPNKLDATVADQVLTNDSPQSSKVIDNLAFAAVFSVLF